MAATHDFECGSCGCYFENLYDNMDDVKDTYPCPECGDVAYKKLCAPIFKVSKKLTHNDRPNKLSDKQYAKEFAEYHMKQTKHRLEQSGNVHYKKYQYDVEKAKNTGEYVPRRLSDAEIKEKIKKAQEFTIDAHKRAGQEDKLGRKIT